MQIIGAQGECRVYKIDAIPDGIATAEPERDSSGAYIISHSEKGHHHVIGGDVDVIEQTEDVPAGMRVFYAIVRAPTSLKQTAAHAHGEIAMPPGIYKITRDREYNPFLEEARAVKD